MIAKAIKGRGFRGALAYDLGKEQGRILASNMAGRTPRELAAEFGAVRRLRPNLGKAVLHVSLSAAVGEKLTDAQWQQIAQHYLRGMGLTNNPFIVTRHTDTEHEHIHLLVSRITLSGKVVSDGRDYARQEVLMREIEKEFGLQSVAPSRASLRKAAQKGEIEYALRTGQPSSRQRLQQLCDAAAAGCDSFTTYVERLEAVGVEVVPVVQRGGAKLSGLSYRLEGVLMKGSDLGRGYAAAGIQQRGVSYEQDRDVAAVRRCSERQAARAFGAADRVGAPGEASARGGSGDEPGAAGAGDGRLERRDAADLDADRAQDTRTGRSVHESVAGRGALVPRGHGRGAQGRGPDEAIDAGVAVEALRPGPGGELVDSGARERILALGGAAQDPEHLEPGSSGARARSGARDRSLEAVQKQMTALGVERLLVGIRDARTGLMMHRKWSRSELERSVPWLKRMNARGNDIYVRPDGDHGLVLVDDLKAEALERMQREGYAPAALLETSPGNFQAWVKLSEAPLSVAVRTRAAQELAQHYGGDLNSADGRHFGRLAGFTNRKPQHTRHNRQPYVLAQACPGTIARAAAAYLQQIAQGLDKEAEELERRERRDALQSARPGAGRDPIQEYQRQAQRLLAQYGADADLSRVDWMIATDMAKSGRFTLQDIATGIRACSPNVDRRKMGHIEDYATRTAAKAWSDPGVRQHREQARQAQRAGVLDTAPGVD
uniref:DNA topoisomerase n=1 Tax=Thiomonas intermedia (strain K12) TaxID=75379 RepID=D5X3W5_THIK1